MSGDSPSDRSLVLAAQDGDFVSAVREGRDPAVSGEDVLPCMAVLEQAQARADRVNKC